VNRPEALGDLEPALVFRHFLALTRIPRPPKEEEQVREHVLAWARDRGLDAVVDAAGNVLVRVPASPGRELAPTVVLQAHLDMVCERDPASPNDPRQGRIEVVRDADWLVAVGTTLGADNGIGVAAALAAAEDPAIPHGPLELLLTVSEEQGLDGAKGLDSSLVSGRLLLNLDGTSDAGITVGCAGSAHTFPRIRLAPEPPPVDHVALEVTLSGARGGHSGADIAAGRANAIKALGRVLSRAYERAPFRLAELAGGVSRNAIPREAHATVLVPAAAEPAFRDVARSELSALLEEHAGTDDGLHLSVEQAPRRPAAVEETTARALDLLAALPTGALAEVPGLGSVETSSSVTVATTEHGVLTLSSMTRSSSAESLEDVVASIQAAAEVAGAEIEVARSYPPWQPDRGSPLLATASETFKRIFGAEPLLEVVHGGLECAVIGGKLPGVRMIAIGPEIADPHAPGERLRISGTQRFYRLLGALLDDLSRSSG
jgi:dipeptidase D